jgi:hypothetical protein
MGDRRMRKERVLTIGRNCPIDSTKRIKEFACPATHCSTTFPNYVQDMENWLVIADHVLINHPEMSPFHHRVDDTGDGDAYTCRLPGCRINMYSTENRHATKDGLESDSYDTTVFFRHIMRHLSDISMWGAYKSETLFDRVSALDLKNSTSSNGHYWEEYNNNIMNDRPFICPARHCFRNMRCHKTQLGL